MYENARDRSTRKSVESSHFYVRTMAGAIYTHKPKVARWVLGQRQSSQIRFPPMVIVGGASISGASPKMQPPTVERDDAERGKMLASESARMEGISF